MGESQSRYSIVERLTTTKITIVQKLGNLDNDISSRRRDIINKKAENKSWEEDIIKDQEAERRERTRAIDILQKQLEDAEAEKESKAKTMEKQIAELDKALRSISEISKDAPNPKDQA